MTYKPFKRRTSDLLKMAVKLENGELESRYRVLLPELSTFMTIHEIPCYVLIYNRIGIQNKTVFQNDAINSALGQLEEGALANHRANSERHLKIGSEQVDDLFERYSSSLHDYLMDFDWSDRDIKKVYEQRKHMVKQMVQSILFLEKFKACFRIIYDSYNQPV